MTSPKTIGAGKSLSLSALNQLVADQEDLLGPLTAIGNDGSQSLLTFDMDQDPPAKHAVISKGMTAPPGSTSVAQGKVFIDGALNDTVATR